MNFLGFINVVKEIIVTEENVKNQLDSMSKLTRKIGQWIYYMTKTLNTTKL